MQVQRDQAGTPKETPTAPPTIAIAAAVSVPIGLTKRTVSEALGTALLLAAVVGSGVMGERLAAGNPAVTLLSNSVATGAALVALIHTFGPVSGAHFNPVVTVTMAWRRQFPWREVAWYVLAQILGALVGVWITHSIFDLPVFMTSHRIRTGLAQWGSESVATFGLLAVIFGCAKARPAGLPFAVAGYITAAYWFTSSTSFANPAVTIARSLTDTFSGIRPQDVPGFVGGQMVGAALATAIFGWLAPSTKNEASGEEP
jgi:glycerol uptake facilitator-like aquaporin